MRSSSLVSGSLFLVFAGVGLSLGLAQSSAQAHVDLESAQPVLQAAATEAKPAPAADPNACTTQKFQVPAVKKACAEGGRKAAKALMKQAVKKAKAAGQKVNCKSCHTSLKTFELKPNAVADLKKWLKG